MIYSGTEAINMYLMQLGPDKIKEVYVGDILVWPDYGEHLNPNGHEYVDMGEAGIWASCNVGATKPEEYGQYFQWADNKGWYDNEIGYTGRLFRGKEYKWAKTTGSSTVNYRTYTVSKYCVDDAYGDIDNKLIIEPSDDGALTNMGGDWRVPTRAEWDKLFDLCNAQFTTRNGVKGTLLTLKTGSSKSIFLPAAGKAFNDRVIWAGDYCDYTVSDDYTGVHSKSFHCSSSYFNFDDFLVYREEGMPIRAILKRTADKSLLPETVTLIASGDGTVGFTSGGGYSLISKKTYGSNIKAYAKPDYEGGFIRWSNGSTDNPYIVSDISDEVLTAHFKMKSKTITIKSESNGRVWFNNLEDSTEALTEVSREFAIGDTATLYAYPDTGSVFDGWNSGDAEVSKDNPYIFTVDEFSASEYTASFIQGKESYKLEKVLGPNTAKGYPEYIDIYLYRYVGDVKQEAISLENLEIIINFTKISVEGTNGTSAGVARVMQSISGKNKEKLTLAPASWQIVTNEGFANPELPDAMAGNWCHGTVTIKYNSKSPYTDFSFSYLLDDNTVDKL